MKEIFYDWGGANVWLFHVINDTRFGWLDPIMQLGTALGNHSLFPFYLGLLTLVALLRVNNSGADPALFLFQVKRWMSVIVVFSIAYFFDGQLLGFLKPLLDFPRPPLALPAGAVNIIGEPEFHHSLPSGHASFAMLLVASLWPLLSRKGRVAGICYVLWVGISRVSLGAHFPADVVAGFASSLAIVLLVYGAISRLTRATGPE